MTVASAYMADISTDENRSTNFGVIGAAWGLGFVLGPLFGGICGALDPRAPFLLAAGLNLLNFLFGLFILPESLPHERRRQIVVKNLNPFLSLAKVLKPSPISALVIVFFLLFLAGQVHPSNWTLYTQTKFGWTTWQVGLSLSFVGVSVAFVQGYLTRLIVPRLGKEKALLYGIGVCIVSFTLFAFATRGWMMYAILLFYGLSGVTMPALQSLLARHVPANEQGELQGSLVSLGSLSSVLGPLLFTFLFVHFTRPTEAIYFPGAAYLGAACICAVTCLLYVAYHPRS